MRASLCLAACLLLAGCAGAPALSQRATGASPFSDPVLSMESARDRIVIGRTSRQDLLEALGPAEVIAFDSGYAVWVYREPEPARRRARTASAERAQLVILTAPSGVVEKVRFRPGRAAAGA